MKTLLVLGLVLLAVSSRNETEEELTFRGEVVEVDLEGSLLLVAAGKGDRRQEKLFEVEELKTEIRSYDEALDEETRITLSDLEYGDHVEVRYEVVKGKNLATVIVKSHVKHA